MPKYGEHSENNVNYVTIELQNETVTIESGAMHFMQGQITVETKMPSLGGILKAGVTGENIFRPTYTGTGRIMLTPSFNDYFMLPLNNESYILDHGAFVACDSGIELSVIRNKLLTGLRAGEGFFQTKASGTGTVVISAHGPIKVLDLVNDKLAVDGNFAVARSANLNYNIQRITKSLLGSAASGEGFVHMFEGTGRVYIAPVPSFANLLSALVRPYASTT